MLTNVITLCPGKSGYGWDIPKIHEQPHISDKIECNKCPQETHSGPTEHNHIVNIKNQSKNIHKNR